MIDVLFVVDNSHAMQPAQDALIAGFAQFISDLENAAGGTVDLHVGVITPDVGVGPWDVGSCDDRGDDGKLQAVARVPGCAPPSDPFVAYKKTNDGSVVGNYSGSLAETFSCIAAVGVDGCGYEQPLEAVRRALDGSNPDNAGFLRPAAHLAVVIVSDEDD